VQTPTIDHLAAEGVRFRNAFRHHAGVLGEPRVVLTGQWARSHVMRNSVPTVKPRR